MSESVYGGRGPAILAVGWTLFAITTLLLALRLYVRLNISTAGGWALFWTFVGYVSITIELIIITVDVHHGLGNHLEVLLEGGEVASFLFYTWMVCFWFDLNIPVGKLSAVSLLLAAHAQTHPKRRYLLWGVAISNMVLAIPNFFLLWFHCNPPSALWDPLRQHQCNPQASLNYTKFLGVWSALSDLIMAGMPALLVWPLQMPLKLKAIISILMGLGVFAAVSNLMVISYLKELTSPDASYDLAPMFFWGKATTWLVLIAASVPPTWPLFQPFVQRRFTTAGMSTGRHRGLRQRKASQFVELTETRLQNGGPEGKQPTAHGRWYRNNSTEAQDDVERMITTPRDITAAGADTRV